MNNTKQYLGKTITVKIDRPLGSNHPKHGFLYEVNYGYIPNTISGDGEELDAYVLGVNTPLSEFTGKCIAVISRTNDDDDKLIVIPQEITMSNSEIEQQTYFQEKWFTHTLTSIYPTIYLMCGFLGFGKTTYAKKLELELPATRFTHDEIMLKHFGRQPTDFKEKYKEVDTFIKQQAINEIKNGKNVILDYGFWSKEKRKEYYQWAKKITPNVCFCAIQCDIGTAKRRVLERTKNNPNELFIDENCFNELLKQYEPITENEEYPITFYLSE